MRVLFTGASSPPGERVLSRLLDQADYSEIWCGVNRRDVAVTQPAELYGGGSREGLDKFVWLAGRLHVVPLL